MALMFRQLMLIGAGALGLVALACFANSRNQRQHSERLLDDALGDSFPASDPTASQDFAIPVNRR